LHKLVDISLGKKLSIDSQKIKVLNLKPSMKSIESHLESN